MEQKEVPKAQEEDDDHAGGEAGARQHKVQQPVDPAATHREGGGEAKARHHSVRHSVVDDDDQQVVEKTVEVPHVHVQKVVQDTYGDNDSFMARRALASQGQPGRADEEIEVQELKEQCKEEDVQHVPKCSRSPGGPRSMLFPNTA